MRDFNLAMGEHNLRAWCRRILAGTFVVVEAVAYLTRDFLIGLNEAIQQGQ